MALNGNMLGLGIAEGNVDYLVSQKLNLSFIGLDIQSRPLYLKSFSYIKADASLLPVQTEAFTIVTAFSLIEHVCIDRRSDFLAEIFRVLEKKGILFLQLPNRYFPIEQHSFLPFIGYLPEKFHNYFNNYYCRVPSLKIVRTLLEKQNFEVRVFSYQMPPSILPFSGLLKFLGFFRIFPFGYMLVCKKRD